MKNVKMHVGEDTNNIPGFLLWQVSKLWQRQLDYVFKDLGLAHTQVIILGNIVRLTKENEKISQILISSVTKVDPVTTSQIIRLLEKKKLIKRVVSSDDKRAYHIVPTDEGITTTVLAIEKL